jgi:ABC1 atypical kinase-like domain
VKIPWVRRDLCGPRVLVMEWIEGLRCTDPDGIKASGINVDDFLRGGVVSGLRQLLEVRRADRQADERRHIGAVPAAGGAAGRQADRRLGQSSGHYTKV